MKTSAELRFVLTVGAGAVFGACIGVAYIPICSALAGVVFLHIL